jgi:hypothetical protein
VNTSPGRAVGLRQPLDGRLELRPASRISPVRGCVGRLTRDSSEPVAIAGARCAPPSPSGVYPACTGAGWSDAPSPVDEDHLVLVGGGQDAGVKAVLP